MEQSENASFQKLQNRKEDLEETNQLAKDFKPLDDGRNLLNIIILLLKKPGKLLYELHNKPKLKLIVILLSITFISLVIYGIVLGTFSGGIQQWIATLKVSLGMISCAFICLPSLFIFACLNGVDSKLSTTIGLLFLSLGICSILLVGFTPVIWIFSQSTYSVVFMGFLHLCFLIIGLYFGLKILKNGFRLLSKEKISYINIWIFVFIMVVLQMTTTIRPILGTSETIFPTEKKFFLVHWVETINRKNNVQQKELYNQSTSQY